MQIILFSSSMDILNEWNDKYSIEDPIFCFTIGELEIEQKQLDDYIVVADYNSISNEINNLISSNQLPKNLIVLEKSPEIVTGKMLVVRGVKAYGNSRMHINHFTQMIDAVKNNKVWTYPELTVALATNEKKSTFNQDSINLINNRLTQKEIQVLFLMVDGLINNAIAAELDITPRTVKAHVSSIFSKLHVNDRVSLILLLK